MLAFLFGYGAVFVIALVCAPLFCCMYHASCVMCYVFVRSSICTMHARSSLCSSLITHHYVMFDVHVDGSGCISRAVQSALPTHWDACAHGWPWWYLISYHAMQLPHVHPAHPIYIGVDEQRRGKPPYYIRWSWAKSWPLYLPVYNHLPSPTHSSIRSFVQCALALILYMICYEP